MDFKTIMSALEGAGTEQNRKVYRRHGVKGPSFGVNYATLGKLQKGIRSDHTLALKLWATGNHDARVLATLVADPARMDAATLDAWARDLDNYVITDAFAKLAARSSHTRDRFEAWIASDDEWVASAGWGVVSALVSDASLPDAYFEAQLATIERTIAAAKNRARYAMNGALIVIGCRNDALEKKAVAVAKRIGPVEVDHGETGCKTPDAAEYIRKTRAYHQARAGRASAATTKRAKRS